VGCGGRRAVPAGKEARFFGGVGARRGRQLQVLAAGRHRVSGDPSPPIPRQHCCSLQRTCAHGAHRFSAGGGAHRAPWTRCRSSSKPAAKALAMAAPAAADRRCGGSGQGRSECAPSSAASCPPRAGAKRILSGQPPKACVCSSQKEFLDPLLHPLVVGWIAGAFSVHRRATFPNQTVYTLRQAIVSVDTLKTDRDSASTSTPSWDIHR